MNEPPRWLLPALLVAVVATSLAAGGAGAVGAAAPAAEVGTGATSAADETPCRGTMTDPAEGGTVVSVQGAHGADKTPARLVGLDPDATTSWVHDSGHGTIWSYDVDPLPNGNLFVTTTIRENDDGDTVVYEFDPTTGERVWQKRFDALDTHDADLINGGREIVVANMRNTGEGGDRIFVYNRTQGEITWEWKFANHGFPKDGGGDYEEDWTHVNDVDKVGEDKFLVSPRNFDQAIVINRTTKEIEHRLGSDGAHDILHEQHNPDYLEGPNGNPTILVADSENDRVVEYEKRDGEWVRTWELTGDLQWPRDADRLPNGNTLITDSRNHRVIEVTPQGEVVWEAYTPWLTYDAERMRTGDGSRGPTIVEQGAQGSYEVHGDSDMHANESALEACAEHLRNYPDRTSTPYDTEPIRTSSPNGKVLYGTSVANDDRIGGGIDPLLLGALGLTFAVVLGGLVAYRYRD